ncbi:DNA translocase FtsK, partial [Vibrio fortis]
SSIDESNWNETDTEVDKVEEQAIDLPWEEVTEEEPAHPDQDVAAFQNIVSEAQANMAAAQNPFLVQKEPNLPKPTSPMPTLELLYHPEKRDNFIDRDALEDIARLVESKLADYKIKAEVVDIFPGPVITRFELDLAPGVKVSRISSLSMDLARSLSAMAVRVVEVIPGKPYVGLELPNMSRQTVFFSDVVGSQQFIDAKSPTTVVMGQDIAGEAVIADIAKMPHVLVAGTTGSGKSVGVNVMILSMLYKA